MTDYDALCRRLTALYDNTAEDAFEEARDAIAALVARVADIEASAETYERAAHDNHHHAIAQQARAEAAEARVKESEAPARPEPLREEITWISNTLYDFKVARGDDMHFFRRVGKIPAEQPGAKAGNDL